MNEQMAVLIADDNVQFGDLLKEYINQNDDMHVVGIARDGLQAVDMIMSLAPDVVVLDIIMPNVDGLGVLEKLSAVQLNKRPSFIMLSALGQDVFVQKAIGLGAEYYIVKPFDVDILVSRIREVYKEKYISSITQGRGMPKASSQNIHLDPQRDMEAIVTNMMRSVGVPPHMTGYQYIREAVLQTVGSSKAFNSVTKVLYPSIADKFNSTPQRVERAIRNAIESAWARGNFDSMNSQLGYAAGSVKSKPTNSEFIAMLADKVRLTLGIKF